MLIFAVFLLYSTKFSLYNRLKYPLGVTDVGKEKKEILLYARVQFLGGTVDVT